MTDDTRPFPLEGIKVVEFAQNAAVPHCGRILAGMGADVVKVEPPIGDAMRRPGHFSSTESKAYAVINPQKRAMVLDLAADDAREVIDALFAWADVVLVGFKGKDLARYGIDWEHARTVNPRLIHLEHLPFGRLGPDADEGGYDVLVQALSGMGFIINRSEDGTPLPSRPAVNDFSTGIASALGVVTALRHRDQTGIGQRVDTALLATALSLSTPTTQWFEATDPPVLAEIDEELDLLRSAGADFDTQRAVYESRILPGHAAFRLYFRHYATSDGLLTVAGLSAPLFKRFHEATGIAAPADMSDATAPEFQAVVAEAEALIASRTTNEWIDTLRDHGYPCGRYNLPHEAVNDPQVRANDFMVDLDHPEFGRYTTSNMPVQFEAMQSGITKPSPALGEHSHEVLAEIGFDAASIDAFVQTGVTNG